MNRPSESPAVGTDPPPSADIPASPAWADSPDSEPVWTTPESVLPDLPNSLFSSPHPPRAPFSPPGARNWIAVPPDQRASPSVRSIALPGASAPSVSNGPVVFSWLLPHCVGPCLPDLFSQTDTPLLHLHYQTSSLLWVPPTSDNLRPLPRFLHLSKGALSSAPIVGSPWLPRSLHVKLDAA